MKTFLLLLLLCFSQCSYGQIKNCFYMDGSSASIDLPCDPDAEVSVCCTVGWRCVSSLYCVSNGQRIIGSCTDRFFKDNACPFPLIACLEDSGKDAVNIQPFTYANNATICPDATVCPYAGNSACCNSGAGKKEILFHYVDIMPSAVRDLSSFYALAGFSIPFSTTSSSSATVSTALTSTKSLHNGAPASAASVSQTGSLSSKQSTSSAIPTPNKAASGLSSSAKAGIGIGAALGISLLVGLAIIFLRRHRRRNIHLDPLYLPPKSSRGPVTAGEIHGRSVPAGMNGTGREPLEMNGESTPADLGRTGRERYEL